ncbi:hypothetical protein GCM10010381_06570 [Streptomyces xantholiticus]|nr:hypothetical protein GCM10010381_06570 [Streptomyces xantholiticus]
MVDPIPLYLPERLEHLQHIADASRLRAALYLSPKPSTVRRRSRRADTPARPATPRLLVRTNEFAEQFGVTRATDRAVIRLLLRWFAGRVPGER